MREKKHLGGFLTNVLCFVFWLHCMACGILIPHPGIELMPPAAEAQGLNHWTAREIFDKCLDHLGRSCIGQ